tara:strand:- start:10791 stop:11102 length:312 start_codon:yes stop_codon:yes gene_type:complete
MKTVRIPFMVSVGQNLYIHFTKLTKEQGLKAYKGDLKFVTGQILKEMLGQQHEVVKDKIIIHGMCAWALTKDTISLSEHGPRLGHLNPLCRNYGETGVKELAG